MLDPKTEAQNPRDVRQAAIGRWVVRAFGAETMKRPAERAARVLEEAAELAQSLGVELSTAQHIMRYVWSRPPGNPRQEAGGVGITLLACCEALLMSADDAELDEVARVLTMPVDHFKQRQAEKTAAGITPGVGRHERLSAPPDILALRLEWKPDPIRPNERVLFLGPIEVGRTFKRGWGDGGQWVAWMAPAFASVVEREGFATLELAMEAVEEMVRDVCDDGSAAHEPIGEARADPTQDQGMEEF